MHKRYKRAPQVVSHLLVAALCLMANILPWSGASSQAAPFKATAHPAWIRPLYALASTVGLTATPSHPVQRADVPAEGGPDPTPKQELIDPPSGGDRTWTVGDPIKVSVTATQATVLPGGAVSLQATTSDSDHWTDDNGGSGDSPDTLHYTWTCSAGTIAAGTDSSTATWMAPTGANALGAYTVTCTVDDIGTTQYHDDSQSSAATVTVANIAAEITQSGATPNPASVGQEVIIQLAAELKAPTDCAYTSGPTWSWDMESLEYRATDSDTWTTSPPGNYSYSVAGVINAAQATYSCTFSQAGQYRIKVKATATYATQNYGSGTSTAEAYVG